jgi:hypothetical protein
MFRLIHSSYIGSLLVFPRFASLCIPLLKLIFPVCRSFERVVRSFILVWQRLSTYARKNLYGRHGTRIIQLKWVSHYCCVRVRPQKTGVILLDLSLHLYLSIHRSHVYIITEAGRRAWCLRPQNKHQNDDEPRVAQFMATS